jgi:serine/threonine protein kinase/tetratricopeptide (TPR) repeat protein
VALPPEHQQLVDDFTAGWLRGETIRVEDFLSGRGPLSDSVVVELIYREFCLSHLSGQQPDTASFLARFPSLQPALAALFSAHEVPLSVSPVAGGPAEEASPFPEAGDEIGPYRLCRELGRGAFARVFLAEEAELENRLVVVKLSTRPTREPWLLARARHPNIVEILSYHDVDDGAFQLICMPFRGGNTLSAVLGQRRGRPTRGRHPGLLQDLDAVAAREDAAFPSTRPARELLARLTDAQALAWITARLAEALDHAFSRDVAHGDIKPSNILLTADGSPMLLDFNLAQDWSGRDAWPSAMDAGGTLAYMAPERLRAIAPGALPEIETSPAEAEGDADVGDSRDRAQRADLYSLGMVLLESLTGASPPPAVLDPEGSTQPPRKLADLAAEYAGFRERNPWSVIRAAEVAGGRTIPPALRAILARCLTPRPTERYRRGVELAEDLDRWRSGRRLAYADEPFWTSTFPRWALGRKKLLAASGLMLTLGLIASLFLVVHLQGRLGVDALHLLARHWDDIEARAFQFQRPESSRLQYHDAPEIVETAARALKDYNILGNPDWRNGDAIRYLPAPDRDELELWLMEMAYRYSLALSDRPGSTGDWQRALAIIDQVDPADSLGAFATLRLRLQALLAKAGAYRSFAPIAATTGRENAGTAGRASVARRSKIPWLDDYLLGVAAELEGESSPQAPASIPARSARPGDATPRDLLDVAMSHYERVLKQCPDSFWAHYRGAVVCFRQERWSEAAGHLERCLRRRPDNVTLHGQLASCLWKLGRLDDALAECTRAVGAAPDFAPFYQSRAFIQANRGRTEQVDEDLSHYETLSRLVPRAFLRNPPAEGLADPWSSSRVRPSQRALDLNADAMFVAATGDPLSLPEEVPPEDLDARVNLAWTLTEAGQWRPGDASAGGGHQVLSAPDRERALSLAAAECDKVLALDPGHLPARFTRMTQALEQGRYEQARADLEAALNHPGLMEYLRSDRKNMLPFLHKAARRFARHGRVDEALLLADKVIEGSEQVSYLPGRGHYTKAVVLAIASHSAPQRIESMAEHLSEAFKSHSKFRAWYQGDRTFDALRIQLDAALDRLSNEPERARPNAAARPLAPAPGESATPASRKSLASS